MKLKRAHIKVWEFESAPQKYKSLSTSGGDEDWVVLIPKELTYSVEQCGTPLWIRKMDSVDEPQRFPLDTGEIVYIGSHA
jgi:hypothetical protein